MKRQNFVSRKYDWAKDFQDGFAKVNKNGLWGLINENGDLICEIIYDSLFDFKGDFAKVCINSKWGAVNKKGELILPMLFDEVYFIKDDWFRVKKNGRYGMYKGNEEVLPIVFDGISNYSGSELFQCEIGKRKFFFRDGIVWFRNYENWNGVKIFVNKNNIYGKEKFGLTDNGGKVIYEPIYALEFIYEEIKRINNESQEVKNENFEEKSAEFLTSGKAKLEINAEEENSMKETEIECKTISSDLNEKQISLEASNQNIKEDFFLSLESIFMDLRFELTSSIEVENKKNKSLKEKIKLISQIVGQM